MFLLISRTVTEDIKKKLHSLLNAGIDAYVIVDKGLEKSTKRFISYDRQELEEAGFTNSHITFKRIMNTTDLKVTGWDKAIYHIYKTKPKNAWICEDDVFWNRPLTMKMILDATENLNDDLIAYPLAESYEARPNWYHWNYSAILTKDKKKWSSTYNQLCRISITLVNRLSEIGKTKHRLVSHEALFATVCKMYNLKKSYYSDLKLPIYINIYWRERLSKEDIEKILNENSYVLIHPVKKY